MENIHLQLLILINTINQAHIGGVLWMFTLPPPKKKKKLLLFDSLGVEGFKFFIADNDENIKDELLYNF